MTRKDVIANVLCQVIASSATQSVRLGTIRRTMLTSRIWIGDE